MEYAATLIPGDGIGPEVAEAAVRVVEAADVKIRWSREDEGLKAVDTHGVPLPDRVLDSIREHRIALKGPLTTPVGKGFRSVNVTLRQELDLYVSLRPVRTKPGIQTHHQDVDLVIFRENTEGLY